MGVCCSKPRKDDDLADINKAQREHQHNNQGNKTKSSKTNYAPTGPSYVGRRDARNNVDVHNKDSKIEQLQRENNEKKDMRNSYTREIQNLSGQISELKGHIRKMENNYKRKENEIESYKKELQKGKSQISHLQGQIGNMENDQRRKENDMKDRAQRQERKLMSLEQDLKSVRQERDDIRSRYSALAANKLTDGNANIANLSDENRPTKLAEKYSELYDNEWTDAFSALKAYKERSDEEVCFILVRAFCVIYSTCKDRAENELKAFISAYCGLCKEDNIPRDVVKSVKDKRKLNTGIDMQEIKKLYNDKMQNIISCEEQKKVEIFLNKSIDLCWLMAIQDPPVYVEKDLSQKEKIFDSNLFKAYTKRGKYIDFIVWPAIFLYEGGSVLCKGVAQGNDFENKSRASNNPYDNVEISQKAVKESPQASAFSEENMKNVFDDTMKLIGSAEPGTDSTKKDINTSESVSDHASIQDFTGNNDMKGKTTINPMLKSDSKNPFTTQSATPAAIKSFSCDTRSNSTESHVVQGKLMPLQPHVQSLKESKSDFDDKSSSATTKTESDMMRFSDWKTRKNIGNNTLQQQQHKTVINTKKT